ncbi:hypothetical protein CCMSSC00406_0006673 [Pleurotus cornucopiae]|uniref:Uncharacterized protein n=1 Tax=Pleurotus cornucopiae TaxID=5321 RepID=A0ACB7ISE6_PLECO|nr:hypothetical protein CCMSSC00406_0006673 [Pleurotus cornucopiae]
MHILVKSLVLAVALGLHIFPAFVAADTTVIPSNSFSSVSTFESFWNYLYPWGSDHNGSARMRGSSTDHSHINVASNTLSLIATPTFNASPPTSSADPHPAIHYASGAIHAKSQITVTTTAGWPPEADIGEWKGTNDNWFNTFNTSSVVRSDLVAWPADLSFHSLKAVLKPESNGADVRIDFFMDNTLRATQFGKGFIGKALWLPLPTNSSNRAPAAHPPIQAFNHSDDDPLRQDRQRSRERSLAENLLTSPRRRRTRHSDENTPPSPAHAHAAVGRPRAAGPSTPLRPIQNTTRPDFDLATPSATPNPRYTGAAIPFHSPSGSSSAPGTRSNEPSADCPSRRALAQRERRARERAQREALAANENMRPLMFAFATPAPSQETRTLDSGTPSEDRRSRAQRERRARERAQREARETNLENELDDNQLRVRVNAREASMTPGRRPSSSVHSAMNGILTPPPTQTRPRSQQVGGGSTLGRGITAAVAGLFMAARRPYREPESRHDLGRMNVPCPHCGALHWADERVNRSRRTAAPEFGMCCDHGKVCLAALPPPPPILQGLLEANDAQAQEFRHNIRAYNMALAFTSLGVREDDSINHRANRYMGGSTWVFRIQGQLYHRSGALEAGEGRAPSYSQLYVYDPQAALQQRMLRNNTLRRDTMEGLQNMLSLTHRYAAVFKHAFEIIREHEQNGTAVSDVEVRLRAQNPPPGDHPRRYNLPTVDEVAMVLPGDGSEADPRDIILRRRLPQVYGSKLNIL